MLQTSALISEGESGNRDGNFNWAFSVMTYTLSLSPVGMECMSATAFAPVTQYFLLVSSPFWLSLLFVIAWGIGRYAIQRRQQQPQQQPVEERLLSDQQTTVAAAAAPTSVVPVESDASERYILDSRRPSSADYCEMKDSSSSSSSSASSATTPLLVVRSVVMPVTNFSPSSPQDQTSKLQSSPQRTNTSSMATNPDHQGDDQQEWSLRCFIAALVSLNFVYLRVAQRVLGTLWCRSPPGLSSLSYVSWLPSLSCSSQDYRAMEVLAIIQLVVYVVGFPLAVCWLLWRSTPEQRAHHDYPLSLFVTHTKPHLYWWHAVLVARKLAIVFVASLLPPRSQASTVCVLMVLMISICPHVYFRPFQLKRDNMVELAVLLQLVLAYQTSLTRRLYTSQDGKASTTGGGGGDDVNTAADIIYLFSFLALMVLAVEYCWSKVKIKLTEWGWGCWTRNGCWSWCCWRSLSQASKTSTKQPASTET